MAEKLQLRKMQYRFGWKWLLRNQLRRAWAEIPKKAAGRTLDGVTHDAFPTTSGDQWT